MMKRFPAEWEAQSFVQIAWPHIETDWFPYLSEANECYRNLTREIAKRENVVIVTPDPAGVLQQLDMTPELARERLMTLGLVTMLSSRLSREGKELQTTSALMVGE